MFLTYFTGRPKSRLKSRKMCQSLECQSFHKLRYNLLPKIDAFSKNSHFFTNIFHQQYIIISAKIHSLWLTLLSLNELSPRNETSKKDFIEFSPAIRRCYSLAGRAGGRQHIGLSSECAKEHILIHEVYSSSKTHLIIRLLDSPCIGLITWASETRQRFIYWRKYDSRQSFWYIQPDSKGLFSSLSNTRGSTRSEI